MNEGLHISDGWCRHIPLLHRIIADPAQQGSFPALAEQCELAEACAYWETLYYLFTTLLGWQRLDKGLGWWYSVNKDDQKEPLLRLVRELWDRDDQLVYFAAWSWAQTCSSTTDFHSPTSISNQAAYGDVSWWRIFTRKGKHFAHDPFYGGTNSLHLGHSQSFGLDESESGNPVLYYDATKREAVVIVGHFTSWRRDLVNLGAKLPSIGLHSWHVEAYDRQVGYLGRFRQSRETGLWFMGKHSIHMRGQEGRQ